MDVATDRGAFQTLVPAPFNGVPGEEGEVVIPILEMAGEGNDVRPHQVDDLWGASVGKYVGQLLGPNGLADVKPVSSNLAEEVLPVAEVVLDGDVVLLSGRNANVTKGNRLDAALGEQLFGLEQNQ